jgi:hypothetical protein
VDETTEVESAPTEENEQPETGEAIEESELTGEESDEAVTDEGVDALAEDAEKSVRSKKGAKRVQQLAERAKTYEAENFNLRKQIEEYEARYGRVSETDAIDPLANVMAEAREALSGKDEVTLAEILEYSEKIAEAKLRRYDAQRQQESIKGQIEQQRNRDILAVINEYPVFDEGSEEYDREVAETVTKHYHALQKSDPTFRLKDYVDEVMSIRQKAEREGRTAVTAKIAAQVASQAVSPTTGVTPAQTDEVEQALEQAIETGSWVEYLKQVAPVPK